MTCPLVRCAYCGEHVNHLDMPHQPCTEGDDDERQPY